MTSGRAKKPRPIGTTRWSSALEPLEGRLLCAADGDVTSWDVALIDRTLPDHAALVRAIQPGGKVFLFDGESESAEQILSRVTTWAESTGSRLRSISLMSHGSAGRFALGTDWISNRNLDDTEAEWRRLGTLMADGASINLFGCNLIGRMGDGKILINRLSKVVGATVFASNDLTGRGGDWVLEAASGNARSSSARTGIGASPNPFSLRKLSRWDGSLASPLGGETRVNTTTTGTQEMLAGGSHAVATDANGNFVVVWSGEGTGDVAGIFGQRYSALGVPQGSEFRVNTTTAGIQTAPAIAMDADGDFVIVWSGQGAGDTTGIFARRYTAAGVAQTASEVRVNTTTTDVQQQPAVATNDAGGFVVTWTSANQDGSSGGIYGQRYNAAGTAQGVEFLINSTTPADQRYSSVAMDADGDFVVTWASQILPGFGWGIAARRYSADGTAAAPEFVVNAFSPTDQEYPTVAMSSAGAFVIAWQSYDQDSNDTWGIYAQRYDANAAPQGGEFRINGTTADGQQHPSIAMDDSGNFVVAWQSENQDGGGSGIYAREYLASGVARGGEYLVNSTTAGNQWLPSVAVDGSGRFVVAWSGEGSGDASGVFAQRFATITPGITVSPTSLSTTEGGTATFDVVLNTRPTADVTIQLTTSAAAQGTFAGGATTLTLTFTPAEWNTPKTVTVYSVDDSVDELVDSVAYTITTAAASSTDAAYSGMNAADVSMTNIDNDFAGFTLSRDSGLITTEGAGQATFTIFLNSQPTNTVIVSFGTSDGSEGFAAPGNYQFNVNDWNQPRIVTVTGVNDSLLDGNIDYRIQITSSSVDPKYNGLGQDVYVTNLDDDTPGITVTPTATPLIVNESGTTTATFSVVLNAPPTQDVLINLSSNDAEASLNVTTLRFTPGNWNTPQVVEVTGVNDHVDDGDADFEIVLLPAQSLDAAYNGIDPVNVAVRNLDDDTAGITVSLVGPIGPTGLITTEAAGTATYTIVLDSRPTADVTIAITSNNTAEGTVSHSILTFTPENWNIAQTVTITGVNDGINDGDITFTIVNQRAVSGDPKYNDRNPDNVSVTNEDDDPGRVLVDPIDGLVTTEDGGDDTFSVVLDSRPLDNVFIQLLSSDDGEGTLSILTLEFTPDNWNVPRIVTVTGINDTLVDGDVVYTIITSATSNDPNFDGVTIADVEVTNRDTTASPPAVATSPGALNYTENAGRERIDPSIVVDDAAGLLTGATVRIVTNYMPGQDILRFEDRDGISGSWDAGTGRLTLTGAASVADYQSALRSVTYRNTSEDPSPATRTVRFTVRDGIDSASAAKAVSVLPVNDAPVGAAEAYTVTAGSRLIVTAAAGVLGNDTDVEGDDLSAVLETAPTLGQLTLNRDGSFRYTPLAQAAGVDSFTYRPGDGQDSGAPVTVTMEIEAAPPKQPTPPTDPTDPPDPVDPEPPVQKPETPKPPEKPQKPEKPKPPAREPARPTKVDVGPGIQPVPAAPATPPVRVQPPTLTRPEPVVVAMRSGRIESQMLDYAQEQIVIDGGTKPGNPEPERTDIAALPKWEITATLTKHLDQLGDELAAETQNASAAAAVVGSAALVWVGYVVYSLRGGALLLTFLTSMPLWSTLDPLPVLEASEARAARKRKKKRRSGEPDDPEERKLRSVLG